MDTFLDADYKKLKDVCPFNIYGRIVYKTRSGWSYYYKLLNYKKIKPYFGENRESHLRNTGRKKMYTVHTTVKIDQYEQII